MPSLSRDLFFVATTLLLVDAIAAFLLFYLYYPARRRETLEKTPAQLALLARDRQNALAGWVRERISDAELAASRVAVSENETEMAALLDRFIHASGYESAFLVKDSGVVVRRGSSETDAASVVPFARATAISPNAKIDFRLIASRKPKVFTAATVAPPDDPAKWTAVVFVSDPYDYVYPLFSTFAIASRTGETNLIGIYGEEGVALNPYPEGSPPPMLLRKRIPKEFAAQALASGEHGQAIQYVDRREQPVIGVVRAIPHTEWVVIAKIDEEEALEDAVAETARLGGLLAFVSLMLASIAFAILRSRRVHEMRVAEEAVRRLSARLLRVQDETRRRIARELHETVAQSLAVIRMNLGVLKRTIGSDGREAEIVKDSIGMTDEAITQTRTLSYLLHPPMIDQAGLLTALRWYVEGFQQRSGIVTTLDAPEELGELSRDIETSVFRIVQESLTNIQRHAGSGTARVSIARNDRRLSIEIADQGRGLPHAVREDLDALLASGVGIAGINERVHEVGGEMTIRSSDQGTTLTVTLPI